MRTISIVNLDAFPTGVITVTTVAMLAPLYPLIGLWRARSSAYWRLTLLGWLLCFVGVGLFTIVLNVATGSARCWFMAATQPTWCAAPSTGSRCRRASTTC